MDQQQAEKLVDDLAQRSDPAQRERLDGQFAAKLDRLAAEGVAPAEMLEQLRLLWRMLKAPDDVVSIKHKALIMAAISYFASPVDLIPDAVGRAGYLDDAMVVRIVVGRLADAIAAFRRSDGQATSEKR